MTEEVRAFKLMTIGFLIIFLGIILIMASALYQASTTGNVSVSGGVLFIFGFIPIGFAFGPHADIMLVLLFILAIIVMIIAFLMMKSFR